MSQMRACNIWKATDGNWYLQLGNFEYAYDDEDCTIYGPFSSEEKLHQYRRANHSNPGSSCTDDSGTQVPPKECERPRGY